MSTEDLWNEADTLPPAFEEKKTLLHGLLKRAMDGLLTEVRKQNILTTPYGRPEQPTSLLSLEQFLKTGGLSEPLNMDDNDNGTDEPIFSYEYGFDPLIYLADYLKFLHPENIKSMRDVRGQAIDFLRFRAAHAQVQMDGLRDLQELTRRLQSGILWGPFVSPSTLPSSSGMVVACKAVKDDGNDVIVEVAIDSAFVSVDRTWTQRVDDATQVQKLVLNNLEPGRTYYLRCRLRSRDEREAEEAAAAVAAASGTEEAKESADNVQQEREQSPQSQSVVENEGVAGLDTGISGERSAVVPSSLVDSPFRYQYCQFTMSPSDEPSENSNSSSVVVPVGQVMVAAVNARSAHLSMAAATAATGADDTAAAAVTSCFLGEVFPSSDAAATAAVSMSAADEASAAASASMAFYQRFTFLLHRYSRAFASPEGVLRNSSLLVAWHDRSTHSDMWLGEEEATIKRFISDYGKYNKKVGGGKGKAVSSPASRKKSSANGSNNADIIPVPPTLERPVLSPSMTALLQALPLEVEGYAAAKPAVSTDPGKGAATVAATSRISTATRQLYSTQMLGPKVQLLCCDYRRGYLGKEQVAWLADTLKNSTATWKLVLTGAPFGVTMAVPSAEVDDDDVAAAESKEIDHLSAASATVEDMTTQHQHQQQSVVSPARTPRENENTVKMTLPPPIEAAGCDEAGRYKLSLQAVIASLQKTAMADNEKTKQQQQLQQQEGRDFEAEIATDEIVDTSSSSVHQSSDVEGQQLMQQQGDGGGLVVSLESGIVILSAGAFALEPTAAAAAAAAAVATNDANAMVSPAFVALYDPCGAGSPFCLEMCIGGGDCFDIADAPATATMSLGTLSQQSRSPPMIASSSKPMMSLGPNVLFDHKAGVTVEDATAAAPASVAALASLDADSLALQLKLVTVAPDGQLDGQPLFACTLVQPNANSPGNDAVPNPN